MVNLRIDNIELRKTTNLYNEKYYEIVKWKKNRYYKQEDNYIWNEKKESYQDPKFKEMSLYIHKSCFNNPETCYTLARFDNEDLRFIKDRPFELDKAERDIFWNIANILYNTIIKNNN